MPTRFSNLPEKVQDFTIVLKGLWFLLLFNIVAVLLFLVLPQGTDVLLAVAEDFASQLPLTTIFLFVGLLFWSIAAEFSARMLIYLSDTSGFTLSDERITRRKNNQRFMARFSLYFPQGLVIVSFLKVYIANHADIKQAGNNSINAGIVIIVALLLAGTLLLNLFYRKNGWLTKLANKYAFLRWLKLPEEESNWAEKLYGIFSTIRVDIPNSIDLQAYAPPGHKPDDPLPKDLKRGVELPNGQTLPQSPYFMADSSNPINSPSLKRHTWLFNIKWRFYKTLLRQLLILAVIAVVIIAIFSFSSVGFYINVGSLGIICLAFACWQVVYTCMHYIDKAQKRWPVRFTFLVLFIVSSVFNNDHPARKLDVPVAQRPQLNQHFDNWLNNLRNDSCKNNYYRVNEKVPVIFINAEGGALRTGAYTAMMLSALSDRFKLLPKYIYGYSGVSGGSVGINLYNATLIKNAANHNNESFTKEVSKFFKQDFLAATTGKLAFGEILNYFIPWHIDKFDRAIALEQGWETSWNNIFKDSVLQKPFSQTVNPQLPAVFINTTEVETGNQCIWSNVRLDSLPLGKERDLNARYNTELPYSTAVNLSSRFPLISPGAAFFYWDSTPGEHRCDRIRRHYVDGGYYENKGAETMLQVLKALHLEGRPVKPYIIQFNFDVNDSTYTEGVKSFNEIAEAGVAVYNTRQGRLNMARYYLKQYAKSLDAEFIDVYLPLTDKKFPMNWVLSNTAVDRLQNTIQNAIKDTTPVKGTQDLARLFTYTEKIQTCVPLPKK